MGCRAEEPSRPVPKSDWKPERGSESTAVDAALAAWRRKATDVTLATVAAVQLPVVLLYIPGKILPTAPLVRTLSITAYIVVMIAALLPGIAYRSRLAAFFAAGFLVAAVAVLALPTGPYAQAGLVTLPILVMVLVGKREAKIASLLCLAILVSAPLLRLQPGVARTLAIDPSAAGPQGLIWMRAAALAAFLAGLTVLLGRFHNFLLEALAALWRTTGELKREMGERQSLEREIAGVSDTERRHLGHELHDGVCQQITAALLRCQVLARRAASGDPLRGGDFQELTLLLTEAMGDARNVAKGLCPLDPDPEALAAGLRALAKRTNGIANAHCEFRASGDVRAPDPAMAQHLYRIAQEALSNAVHHAHASRISVELRGSADELLLEVEDDGVGLPAQIPVGGMGLRTMAYRARLLQGDFSVAPAPGGGARVTCRVPRVAGPLASQDRAGGERWIPT